MPDAFLSINELKKLVLLEILKQGKAEEIIGEFVNLNNNKIFDRNFIYEIKNELNFDNDFHRKFQGKKTFAYEKPEQTDLQNRKQKLNEILQKHNLNIKQIPSRIIDYWLKIKEVKDDLAIANRIKAMKTDCKDRLKAKKKGKAPKIGEMASFLARDIVDMVIDLDTKKKITSFYYDKMQESLALFADPEKRQIFTNICKELNLLNKEKGHPFLIDIQIQEIKNTYDFYEKYLIEKGNKVLTKWNGKKKVEKDVSWIYMNFYKLEWNEKVKKNLTVVSLPNDLSKIPLTISNLKEKEKSNFDTWLKNKKEKPIDLPVNLFDNALVDVLRKKLHEKNVAYKTNDKYFYLLKLWLGIEKLQPFYNYEREYTVYDEKINFKPGTKSKVKDYFEGRLNTIKTKEKNRRKEKNLSALQDIDVRKVLNNAITENEKVIRFTHEQDRILLLMIKNIIQSGSNLNIALDNIDTALNETVKVSQTISGKLSFFDENGKKIEKDDEKPKIEKIITDNRKRKDFSVLKKLTSDRRLPELFQYFDESEIPYPKLKVELDSYNKVKDLIFDRAFELEIALINKAKDEIIRLQTNDSKNIQHEPYLKWLQKENHINTDEFNFLKVVRNTFSHNQFPPKVIVDIFHTLDKSKPIAGQIYNIYDEKIRMLLQKMEKE